jgi:penicillin V acylase-like amidase (Ntn superfamily)
MKRIATVLILLGFFVSGEVFACSGVFVNRGGKCFIGRTMDWRTGHTNVVVNERGIKKQAQFLQDRSSPAKWTSKYGSLTFDLQVDLKWYVKVLAWISRINTSSAPSCGINERGLYGGSFWIHPPPAVQYNAKDGRPSVNDWQMLEYVLDTSATVDEAINNINKVRVSGFKEGDFEVDLHWLFADAGGDCAIIEFVDGRLKAHKNPVIPVITNSFYEHSREYTRQYKGFGGTEVIPTADGEMTTENRFLFLSSAYKDLGSKASVGYKDIFGLMKQVTQTSVRHANTSQALTQWTAVYDLKAKKLWWTNRVNDTLKYVDVKKLDMLSSKKGRVLDSFSYVSGDVTKLFAPNR